jgi:hypothetical protein
MVGAGDSNRKPALKFSPTSLLDSAKSFLEEGLRQYQHHATAFAILHTVTAVELVLKERLHRINPSLVYRDIDAPPSTAPRTITLDRIPQRLANLGFALDPDQASLISCFAKWRNEVVHHLPTYDERAARAQLPQLLDFVARTAAPRTTTMTAVLSATP